jgi:glycosyltransferase involved in cell wall biosynthesis
MIRVACLSDAAYEGGAERYLVRLAGGLDRSRFQPLLLLPADPSLDPLERRAAAAGIEVRRHPRGRFAGAADPGTLLAALRRAGADLVHLNLPSTYDLACGWAAPLARAAGAKAVVSTEHIADIPRSRRRVLAKRAALGWIARVIAISREHCRLLAERHGVPSGKIRIIYNGVEDSGQPAVPAGDRFRIVCVGALHARKGQDLLLESLAALVARGVAAELTLVGEGPARFALESQARTLGLGARVRFTGRVESVDRELRNADVLAVPSRLEGLPFAVLEGFAAGLPVVAAALPGLDEVIDSGRNGLLVPPEDVAALTGALAGLALDPPARLGLARAGRREFEQRFTLERMVRETEALYAEVLS